MKDGDVNRNKAQDDPLASANGAHHQDKSKDMKLWGVFIFGLIGATATTFAVSQLRRTVNLFYAEERIRRMQSVFNRERNKKKKSYESWTENDYGANQQNFQRDDWYWKTDTSYKDRRTNYRESPRENVGGSHSLSHHYSVLGLDRFRGTPYTDAEIKTAFRARALEFHPDQNQQNKEAAEEKFKEVMLSYETIKKERNTKSL